MTNCKALFNRQTWRMVLFFMVILGITFVFVWDFEKCAFSVVDLSV